MDKLTDKLRSDAAARYVGLAPSTMAKMRVRGDGPPYSKAGSRVVVYDVRDLDEWLQSTRRTSTRSLQSIATCRAIPVSVGKKSRRHVPSRRSGALVDQARSTPGAGDDAPGDGSI